MRKQQQQPPATKLFLPDCFGGSQWTVVTCHQKNFISPEWQRLFVPYPLKSSVFHCWWSKTLVVLPPAVTHNQKAGAPQSNESKWVIGHNEMCLQRMTADTKIDGIREDVPTEKKNTGNNNKAGFYCLRDFLLG